MHIIQVALELDLISAHPLPHRVPLQGDGTVPFHGSAGVAELLTPGSWELMSLVFIRHEPWLVPLGKS
jgi:hypothetical protein